MGLYFHKPPWGPGREASPENPSGEKSPSSASSGCGARARAATPGASIRAWWQWGAARRPPAAGGRGAAHHRGASPRHLGPGGIDPDRRPCSPSPTWNAPPSSKASPRPVRKPSATGGLHPRHVLFFLHAGALPPAREPLLLSSFSGRQRGNTSSGRSKFPLPGSPPPIWPAPSYTSLIDPEIGRALALRPSRTSPELGSLTPLRLSEGARLPFRLVWFLPNSFGCGSARSLAHVRATGSSSSALSISGSRSNGYGKRLRRRPPRRRGRRLLAWFVFLRDPLGRRPKAPSSESLGKFTR